MSLQDVKYALSKWCVGVWEEIETPFRGIAVHFLTCIFSLSSIQIVAKFAEVLGLDQKRVFGTSVTLESLLFGIEVLSLVSSLVSGIYVSIVSMMRTQNAE